MTVSEYFQIKQQIMLHIGSSNRINQTLVELKEHFREKINSPRRCEQIKTIGQLLHVLEVRDLLSEDKVQALKDIAQIINCNPEIINKLNQYERRHVPEGLSNCYNPEITENVLQKEPFKTFSKNNPYANLSNKKLERINRTLVELIGTYWRDLARNLKIRECEIDDIESSYASLQAKAEKVFEIYEDKADPQKWLLVLCEALEKSRRKDLAKTIHDILLMNI